MNRDEYLRLINSHFGYAEPILKEVVYIAVSSDFLYCKIGITKNLRQRLIGVRAFGKKKYQQDFVLLHSFPGNRHLEQSLHGRFREYCDCREWYRVDGDLADFLASVQTVHAVKNAETLTISLA